MMVKGGRAPSSRQDSSLAALTTRQIVRRVSSRQVTENQQKLFDTKSRRRSASIIRFPDARFTRTVRTHIVYFRRGIKNPAGRRGKTVRKVRKHGGREE
ncbi:hypothetical protein Dda3937_04608 [Dickeya dadantii 3937]|uniref:Uncharacterized protein n=1 Tax=Dickeya dadantii (strain 3937) TaxID=198628 RepID=E0SF44_DICD3|nr:hypothetical protein Dda3937_04608 [Dickeya dadantii 3937]